MAVAAITNVQNATKPPNGATRISTARLYRDPRAPQRARQLLTEWLGKGDELLPDALQIVSELVTNGVIHPSKGLGREWLVLSASRGEGFILLEVTDPGVVGPVSQFRLRMPDITAESGRGLSLVAAYSKDWGTYTTEASRRVVWAVLAYPTE
ncbi:ATP-binding protein [Nonomuraea sp. M3C6]|uniref:ATP-binding protein n=1 Tax=Nonomuraea marmarensis TaxID=3351344 RepID=A0ABW7AEM8_9ACTN